MSFDLRGDYAAGCPECGWRRDKRGLCIKCGYDLRGAISIGCPECGWRWEAEA